MAVTLGGMTLLTANDSGTGWTGTDGVDTYGFSIQGANSESWQLSKNATETGTLTVSASMPTSRGIYTVWLASSIKAIYTSIDLALQSSTNNNRAYSVATSAIQAVDGAFKAFAFDYVNKGIQTGTFNPASLTSSIFTIVTQNINFRAIPNNWIDTIHYGAGHTIAGTTVGDKLFTEAASEDISGNFYYGVLENYNGKIFSQGDISLTGTALTSNGESLVFKETANGYDIYEFGGTGTATFINSNIESSGAVRHNMNMSSMTAFSMSGGSIVKANVLTLVAGQTLDGVVITDMVSASIGNTPLGTTFNQCGPITVVGVLNDCTVNKSTSSAAVISVSTAKALNCTFIKDVSASHALQLTGSASTYSWSATATGYTAGTSGNGVQITGGSITGNETIHITASSGTFTINVVDGATVPSVSTAGAIVNVVAGQKTFTQTITPLPTPNYEYRLYTVTAEGSMEGSVEITAEGEENATSGSHSFTHSYSNQPVAVQIISDDYVEKTWYDTLTAADKSITITLDVDNND